MPAIPSFDVCEENISRISGRVHTQLRYSQSCTNFNRKANKYQKIKVRLKGGRGTKVFGGNELNEEKVPKLIVI